jgi:glycosyltransferase involved in cell wall biosynthesis
MKILLTFPDLQNARFKVAGYLGKRDEKWFADLRRKVVAERLADRFEFLGEVDLPAKLNMLDSLDAFTVPTVYPEAKGIYVLEAMARAIPVVQPAHGSFPELIEQTQGGLLVPPNDPRSLAEAVAALLCDPPRRQAMGRAGRSAVETSFTEEHMARNMMDVFNDVLQTKAGMVQA